jgi:tetratricopeptide (TPR) repeat protein
MEFFDDSFQEFDETIDIITRFESMLSKKEVHFFDLEEYETMIDYYFDIQNITKANLALSYASSQFPESASLKLREAQLASSNGKLNTAMGILNKLEMQNPLDEDVLLSKASLFSQLRQHKKAIEYYEKVLNYTHNNQDDLLIDIALEYEFLQEYPKAIEKLKESLIVNPENEASLYEIAYCYDMIDGTQDCIDFLNAFIDQHPYNYTAWLNLGNCFMKLDFYEKAVEALEYCVAIKEDFSFAHLNIALCHMELENWQLALDSFLETLKHEPQRAMTLTYIGECYEKLGALPEAKKYYQKALAEDDNWGDAWLGLGVILDLEKKTRDAIPFIQRAIDTDNENPDYWHVLAEAWIRLGELEKAEEAVAELIKLDPNNAETVLSAAELLELIYGQEEAIEFILAFQQYTEEETPAELLYRLAGLSLNAGKIEIGLSALEEALTKDFEGHKTFLDYFPEATKFAAVVQLIEMFKRIK